MNRDDLVRKVVEAVTDYVHTPIPFEEVAEIVIDNYNAALLAEAADPESVMVKAAMNAARSGKASASAALVAGIKAVGS